MLKYLYSGWRKRKAPEGLSETHAASEMKRRREERRKRSKKSEMKRWGGIKVDTRSSSFKRDGLMSSQIQWLISRRWWRVEWRSVEKECAYLPLCLTCVCELLKSNSYFKLHGNESNLPCQDGLSHFRYHEPYSHGGNFPLSPLRVGSSNAGIM